MENDLTYPFLSSRATPVIQDTLRTGDTVRPGQLPARTFTVDEVQEILLRAERRQQMIDSANRADQIRRIQARAVSEPEPPIIDSADYILFETRATPFDIRTVFFSKTNRERITAQRPDSLQTAGTVTHTKELVERPLVVNNTNSYHYDWILVVLLISAGLLAWLKLFYNRMFAPVLKSLVNQQEAHKLFRDKSLLFEKFSFVLNLHFVLNAALFLFFATKYFLVEPVFDNNLVLYAFLALFVVSIYLLRMLVCRLVGLVSLQQELFAEYVHQIFLINKSLGLVLFPILIGIPYLPEIMVPVLIFTGLAVIGTGYLLRLFRVIQIFVRKGVSIFYLFLYLCALEIMPISVAVKYIQSLS